MSQASQFRSPPQQAVTDRVCPDLAELEKKTCSCREDGRNQVLKASDFAFWQQKLYGSRLTATTSNKKSRVVDNDEG